ncbi:MAG TPA: hypothetical protein VLN45_05080 [Ignavibacteriaceae bacterium]|nr:hypothetical protein [Ignavibacteriaceae bacterium]
MKTVILFLMFLFSSESFSQSDEIKLWGEKEPLLGKIKLIKITSVEFHDSTGLLHEFDNKEINYLKASGKDTIWFNKRDGTITKRVTVFFSYDFLGEHKPTLNNLGTHDVNAGISLGAEFDFLKTYGDAIKFGVGAIYQFSRKPINSFGSFNFIPIYAYIKLGMVNEQTSEDEEKFKIYFMPTLGYNFFYGNGKYSGGLELDGGLYNSLGLGTLIRNKLDIKLNYKLNRGSIFNKKKKEELEISYKSFGLYFGYYF